MSAIGVGDWLEAVRDIEAVDGTRLVRGRLYVCTEVGVFDSEACDDCSSTDWLDVAGMPVTDYGWCPCRFKPVYRPKASIIQSLKQPSPERERETASAPFQRITELADVPQASYPVSKGRATK